MVRRGCLAAISLYAGCGPVSTLESSAPQPTAPAAADASPSAELPVDDSRIEASPHRRAVHEDHVVTSSFGFDVRSNPPRTAGWYCFRYRRFPNDRMLYSECYRAEYTCRVNMWYALRYSPRALDFVLCRVHETAACFTLTNPAERFSYPGCYEDLTECEEMRASTRVRSPPYVTLGACEVSE